MARVGWRDELASYAETRCDFCKRNKAITPESAKKHGVKGLPTASALAGWNTCWTCKTTHASVKTRAMFEKRAIWAKNPSKLSFLLNTQPSFTHRPKRADKGPTRTSRFWFRPAIDGEETRLKEEARAKREAERKAKKTKKRKKGKGGKDEDELEVVADPNPKIHEVIDLRGDDDGVVGLSGGEQRKKKMIKKEKKVSIKKEAKVKVKVKREGAKMKKYQAPLPLSTPVKSKVKRERKEKRKRQHAFDNALL